MICKINGKYNSLSEFSRFSKLIWNHQCNINAIFTSIYQQNHIFCEEIKETRPKHVKTSEHAEKINSLIHRVNVIFQFSCLFCSNSQKSQMSDLKVASAFKGFSHSMSIWHYEFFWEGPTYRLGSHNYDLMRYRFSVWINWTHFIFLSFHLTNTGSVFSTNATL